MLTWLCLQNQLLPPLHPHRRLRRLCKGVWGELPLESDQLQQQDPLLPVNSNILIKAQHDSKCELQQQK